MLKITRTLKLLSDPTRLRIMLLLSKKELCVCQIMGVLEISQCLISKNLHLLSAAGFLEERKEGKLVFYSLSKDISDIHSRMISLMTEALKGDTIIARDIQSLKECEEFQKRAGTCDMKTFKEFINRKSNNKGSKRKEQA